MKLILLLLAIIGLVCLIKNNCSKLKEGVTFTNYDNYHTFNMKPWDEFCISNYAINENKSIYSSKTNGITLPGAAKPGNYCKNGVSTLTNSCTDIDFNPYVEYRR